MVKNTQKRVSEIIDRMRQGKHIDDMTNKWLSQTPNPLRIPIFYKLTIIHMPILVGRPLISGCDGPIEKKIIFCVDTAPDYSAIATIPYEGMPLLFSIS